MYFSSPGEFFFLPEKNSFSRRTFFFSGRNFISKLSQNIPQILTDLNKKFSRRRRFSPGEVFSSPGENFSSPGEVLPWIYWSWNLFFSLFFGQLFIPSILMKIFSRRVYFFSRRIFFFSRRNFYPKQSKKGPIFSPILNTNFSRRSFFFSGRRIFFSRRSFTLNLLVMNFI